LSFSHRKIIHLQPGDRFSYTYIKTAVFKGRRAEKAFMSEQRRKRTIIGVLVDWTVDSYQQLILSGILDFARGHDAHCVCFEGGAINSPNEYEAQRSGIFELAGPDNVDGLVVLSASLGQFVGPDGLIALCRRFSPLPIVSIGQEVPGTPAVTADNRIGLRELIVHLIEKHRARRFAFIKGTEGNPDANERFETFRDALRERGLALDPRNVFQGNFMPQAGCDAVTAFLQAGIEEIDAIVAANDSMAVGAQEELSRRAPDQAGRLIVTGFDDLDIASYARPPLTTVRLPIYDQGWTSAELLAGLIQGQTAPPHTVLPTTLVIRESCGCSPRPITVEEIRSAVRPATAEEKSSLLAGRSARDLGERLGETLRRGLRAGEAQAFIQQCEELSRLSAGPGIEFSSFLNLLYGLWSNRPGSGGLRPTEADLCFQAVMNLGQRVIQHERERTRGFSYENRALQLISELLATFNTTQQMGILAFRLPEVGLATCYVALFQRDREQAVSLLDFSDGRRSEIVPGERVFPTRLLIPDGYLSGPERRSVIVKALKQIGFIVFDAAPNQFRFLAFLSDILAGALQAALLFRELQAQKNGISQNLENLRKTMAGFIQTMALTVESRDPYTAGHQNRVSDLARNIAQELKLPAPQVEAIRMAGIIHDLGKIYVPSEILNHSGVLEDIELSIIKRHPQVAYDILKNVDFPWPIASIIYQHHERLDGSGYPQGLSGSAISLEARILAVADVVEAMASHRPYREALGIEMALAEIVQNKGTLYDADVVDACVRLFINKGYVLKK
jgi:putative nucleotidyltransferase with HDIG domain